jgi:hypothetical protein
MDAVCGTFCGIAGCGIGAAGAVAAAVPEAVVPEAVVPGAGAAEGAEVRGATRVITVGARGVAWDLGCAGWPADGCSGSACKACRSTVTCADTGVATVSKTALRIGKGRI